MKKLIPALLALTLLLSACAVIGPDLPYQNTDPLLPTLTETEPVETDRPAPTEPTSMTGLIESAAFTGTFPACVDTVLAFIYNEPFTNGGIQPTTFWNNAPYERLVIVPRWAGSTVSAWAVTADDEGFLTVALEPTYTTVAEDGCAIGACLPHGEVFPAWYITVETAGGACAGLFLEYNGRYGTPRYEFIEDYNLSALITEQTGMEDWNVQFDCFGEQTVWPFWREAARRGEDPWALAGTCFSEFAEAAGDSAAFTVSEGEMDGGVFDLQTARFREGFYDDAKTLAENAAAQYAAHLASGEDLWYQLTGLTVFNPSLAAKTVSVTVDGVDFGTFTLTPDDFCTAIPLNAPVPMDLAPETADRPVRVTVAVLETNYGAPADAILQVWPGLDSNLSGGR